MSNGQGDLSESVCYCGVKQLAAANERIGELEQDNAGYEDEMMDSCTEHNKTLQECRDLQARIDAARKLYEAPNQPKQVHPRIGLAYLMYKILNPESEGKGSDGSGVRGSDYWACGNYRCRLQNPRPIPKGAMCQGCGKKETDEDDRR